MGVSEATTAVSRALCGAMPWRASVLWCKRSANPPKAHQERAARTLNARWFELDTGHYPMLSTPKELAAICMQEP